jgi:hypothetical protein
MKITLEQKDKLEIAVIDNCVAITQFKLSGDQTVLLDLERLALVLGILNQCMGKMMEERGAELSVIKLPVSMYWDDAKNSESINQVEPHPYPKRRK